MTATKVLKRPSLVTVTQEEMRTLTIDDERLDVLRPSPMLLDN